MRLKVYTLFLLTFASKVYTRDEYWVRFVRSYIENEGKPTFLIFSAMCWSKRIEINLAREVSKIGSRFSTSMEIGTKYHYHDLLFLVDMKCPRSEEIIALATWQNLFRSPYRWLFITDETDYSNLSLWKCPILIDSDVVLATRMDNLIKMVEIHKPSPNQSMLSSPRGSYSSTLADTRVHRQLFRRRRDLMGHTLTMSNVIQDSNTTRLYLPLEDYGKETHLDPIAKICWMNARLAFQMLNASSAYIFSYRWGYKVDGQWSGMIEHLYSGRADLGTSCAVSNLDRLSAVTWTDSVVPFTVRFIFRQPPLPYVANIFSMPFSTNVWIAVSVCAAMATVCLYASAKWEGRGKKGPTQLSNIGDAMLLALSAIGQQGCVMEPKKLSGRIIVLVLFTALMALYAAYSANIVVLLQAPSYSIRTLPQLANSKITLAALDADYNYFVFKFYSQNDPVRIKIGKRIDPEKGKKHFYSLNEGVERVRKGLFAFHAISDPVYRRIEKTFLSSEKCDLVEIDYMNSFGMFVPVSKHSPYVELLKVVFKQLRESGIQSCLAKRMLVSKPHCTQTLSSFSSVGLLEMKPVLILMLYGILGSVVILGLEILVHKIHKRQIVKTCHGVDRDKINNTNPAISVFAEIH